MLFDVIIPALNEEVTIGAVVTTALNTGARLVVVVDNGSTDSTAQCAADAGASVVFEPTRGYGQACLTGIATLASQPPEWVLFCDGDGADDPDGLSGVISAARTRTVDFVIGNRANGSSEPGALTLPQRFGNRLACGLIKVLYRTSFKDLGPLRMIRWSTLQDLDMQDRAFGWTVEMQVKAAKRALSYCEVDVVARCRRGGQSKISGTIRGSVMAGATIISTIFRQVYRNE